MCDIVPGEVLVGAQSGSAAADFLQTLRQGQPFAGLSTALTIDEYLRSRGMARGDAGYGVVIQRHRVPPGTETATIGRLQREYFHWRLAQVSRARPTLASSPGLDLDSEPPLFVQPNHVVTGADWPGPAFSLVPWADDPLAGTALAIRPPMGPNVPTVLVLDTGIDLSSPALRRLLPSVSAQWNLVDEELPDLAIDRLGHGTAVAACIGAVDRSIRAEVVKVLGDDSRGNEFDVLAGLSSTRADAASVINLSLATGLQTFDCGPCGTRHHSSLSELFRAMVDEHRRAGRAIVAAAGNHVGAADPYDSAHIVAYPARFTGVVAVGGLDGHGGPLETSNVAPLSPAPHERSMLLYAPGRAAVEFVEDNGAVVHLEASSYAAAYVSGVLAVLMSHSMTATAAIAALVSASVPLDGPLPGRYGSGTALCPMLPPAQA